MKKQRQQKLFDDRQWYDEHWQGMAWCLWTKKGGDLWLKEKWGIITTERLSLTACDKPLNFCA
jgi:hypothetical protein